MEPANRSNLPERKEPLVFSNLSVVHATFPRNTRMSASRRKRLFDFDQIGLCLSDRVPTITIKVLPDSIATPVAIPEKPSPERPNNL